MGTYLDGGFLTEWEYASLKSPHLQRTEGDFAQRKSYVIRQSKNKMKQAIGQTAVTIKRRYEKTWPLRTIAIPVVLMHHFFL